MCLVSLFGYLSVAGQSPVRLTIYSILLCLLLLAHAAVVVLVFAEQQTALDWINSHSGDSQDVRDAEDFLKGTITQLLRL